VDEARCGRALEKFVRTVFMPADSGK
jgi:hypothetical protein